VLNRALVTLERFVSRESRMEFYSAGAFFIAAIGLACTLTRNSPAAPLLVQATSGSPETISTMSSQVQSSSDSATSGTVSENPATGRPSNPDVSSSTVRDQLEPAHSSEVQVAQAEPQYSFTERPTTDPPGADSSPSQVNALQFSERPSP
jgi:hypothetical protein